MLGLEFSQFITQQEYAAHSLAPVPYSRAIEPIMYPVNTDTVGEDGSFTRVSRHPGWFSVLTLPLGLQKPSAGNLDLTVSSNLLDKSAPAVGYGHLPGRLLIELRLYTKKDDPRSNFYATLRVEDMIFIKDEVNVSSEGLIKKDKQEQNNFFVEWGDNRFADNVQINGTGVETVRNN